jgi:MIP family channel proteins
VIRNRCYAEVFGTFALVFTGCGAVIVNDLHGGGLGHLGINIVFGLIVMAMVYSIGNVSGAHINPAVTLGFYFAGRFPANFILPYIASQFAGAILAGVILKFLFPAHPDLGSTSLAVPVGNGVAIEILLTFILMYVILNVSTGHKEKGIMAGVAVGGVVTLNALIGGPLTGAAMNPARALGPALASMHLQSIWLYLVAPVVGALLAWPACRLTQGPNCRPPPAIGEDP